MLPVTHAAIGHPSALAREATSMEVPLTPGALLYMTQWFARHPSAYRCADPAPAEGRAPCGMHSWGWWLVSLVGLSCGPVLRGLRGRFLGFHGSVCLWWVVAGASGLLISLVVVGDRGLCGMGLGFVRLRIWFLEGRGAGVRFWGGLRLSFVGGNSGGFASPAARWRWTSSTVVPSNSWCIGLIARAVSRCLGKCCLRWSLDVPLGGRMDCFIASGDAVHGSCGPALLPGGGRCSVPVRSPLRPGRAMCRAPALARVHGERSKPAAFR